MGWVQVILLGCGVVGLIGSVKWEASYYSLVHNPDWFEANAKWEEG